MTLGELVHLLNELREAKRLVAIYTDSIGRGAANTTIRSRLVDAKADVERLLATDIASGREIL